MARIFDRRWRAGVAFAGVVTVAAACTPAPPFEEVSDPFAPLPQAVSVTTAPLASPGAISDEVITPAQPPAQPPTGSGSLSEPFSGQASSAPFGQDQGGDGSAPDSTQEGGIGTVTELNDGGLLERLPNTCQLENYQQFQGTDGLIATGLVTDRPARLVAPGDIVSQLYDPQRVNFYTDANGRVTRISCG